MYYLYILYSPSIDHYYVGYNPEPYKRWSRHNNNSKRWYTGKADDWSIKALFLVSDSKTKALQMERFIKKQKSRRFLERLCDSSFMPEGKLADLQRIEVEFLSEGRPEASGQGEQSKVILG